VTLTVAANGRAFVAFDDIVSSPLTFKLTVYTSTDYVTWTQSLALANNGARLSPSLVSLTGAQVYLTYVNGGGTAIGYLFDGTAWGSSETISARSGGFSEKGIVTVGNVNTGVVYVFYPTSNQIFSNFRNTAGTWASSDTAVGTLQFVNTSCTSDWSCVTASYDPGTSNVYIFAIDATVPRGIDEFIGGTANPFSWGQLIRLYPDDTLDFGSSYINVSPSFFTTPAGATILPISWNSASAPYLHGGAIVNTPATGGPPVSNPSGTGQSGLGFLSIVQLLFADLFFASVGGEVLLGFIIVILIVGFYGTEKNRRHRKSKLRFSLEKSVKGLDKRLSLNKPVKDLKRRMSLETSPRRRKKRFHV
jgi:hypothetical protein